MAIGATVTNIGLSLPEKPVPSDNVPDHGPCPVSSILNIEEFPAHIEVVPLIFPVGISLQEVTVTTLTALVTVSQVPVTIT